MPQNLQNSYLETCNDAQLKSIYDEFNVTRESLQADVQILIEWLEKQIHLPNVKDEDFLIKILLRNKISIEKSKRQLNNYYIMKAMDLQSFRLQFKCTRMDLVRKCSRFASYIPLPKLTPEGNRVLVFKIFDPDLVPTIEESFHALSVVADSLIRDMHKSIILLFNAADISVSLIPFFLMTAPKTMNLFVSAYRLRAVKFYILNMNPAFDAVIKLCKSIMSAKEAEKIVIWRKSVTNLSETIPKEILPSDFGGDEKSLLELRELICDGLEAEHKSWIEGEDGTPLADLNKIPNKDQYEKDKSIYGVEGTFKKLAVD